MRAAMRAAMLAAMLGLGLASSSHAQSNEQVLEQVVAFVDEEPIFLSELRARAAHHGAATMEPDRMHQTLLEVLDMMIDERLIAREAHRLLVAVTDDELLRARDSVRLQNNLDEESFQEALRAQGYSDADYEQELRAQLLRRKVMTVQVAYDPNLSEERFAAAEARIMERLRIEAYIARRLTP